jgi:tRNA(fMet)-specific endonuclease VapC
MICLDTNAVIAAINQRKPAVRRRLEQALVDRVIIGIPAVVLYEIWYGIRKSMRPQANAAVLATFLALDVTPWPFESEDAEEAGDIRVALERAGTPIGPYDVLIAAQARRRNAVLITANEREFARVPGLKTEDWASPE